MLRVLVCPQEFKGSLTGAEAAAALAAGVRRALAGAVVDERPMADGGPGTAAIVAAAGDGRLVLCAAPGPLGEELPDARYARLDAGRAGSLAVVEAAATAGLVLIPPPRRAPALASSRGVGTHVAQAVAEGVHEVVVGVGGTGTNDGGAGAAQALGLRLLDAAGDELPPGGIHLIRLAHVDATTVHPALGAARLRIAVDVTNPLLGPSGATAVYGPQKGVGDWLAPALEEALAWWAERLRADLGVTLAEEPGAGAGGGLGVGLIATARAAGGTAGFESGATLVAEAVGLRAAIEASDLVITGEGRMDTQTGFGKAVAHVATLAGELGKPCLAVAGTVDGLPPGIADAESLTADGVDLAEAMRRAGALVEEATVRLLARHVGRDGVPA